MRVYVGNQFQDNGLANIGSFNPAVINTGQYCTMTAGNTPVIFNVTPQPYIPQFAFIATTFYVYGNPGVSGGTIQPQIQLADNIFRDYGTPIPASGPGFLLSVVINTPVLGVQFNVTSAITGGSVFLEIDCLMG